MTVAETPRSDSSEAGPELKKKQGLRLALLAGILFWLSGPPVGIWPLAWVALAPLIVSIWRAKHARQAAWRGYLFGWAYLGPVWYWVGFTIVGWTSSPIGWLAWFGLTLVLALFYAIFAAAAWFLSRRTEGKTRMFGIAALWVVMEWARTLGPVSMPWAQLSYTQYHFLPVVQIADITGAYGVSFLLILVSAAAAHFWEYGREDGGKDPLWMAGMLAVMVCLYGTARMQQHDRGTPLVVADMQTGISSFNVPSSGEMYASMQSLVQKAASHRPAPQLYVWPETAAPQDALHNFRSTRFFRDMARNNHAAVDTGTVIYGQRTNSETNSTLLFTPDQARPDRYDKQQLVPFGEFIPFRALVGPLIGHAFSLPPDDMTPGTAPHVLRGSVEGTPLALGPFICYESMYPCLPREMTAEGANLLVTQSNDSWFRSAAAREQHLSAVVLRAVENRREVVRSTTTGITCIIDAEGRVVKRLPLDDTGAIVAVVQCLKGETLYTRLGDWFVLLCFLVSFWLVKPWQASAWKRK